MEKPFTLLNKHWKIPISRYYGSIDGKRFPCISFYPEGAMRFKSKDHAFAHLDKIHFKYGAENSKKWKVAKWREDFYRPRTLKLRRPKK